MSKFDAQFRKYIPQMDEESVRKDVENIILKSKSSMQNKSVYCQLISHVDLTSLKSTDSAETISNLVQKVNNFDDKYDILPHPAAICVYPVFASVVKEELTEDVKIACVAGGFPHSQVPIEVKMAEVGLAVSDGADEIDIVLPVGAFLSGDYQLVYDEISEIKSCCGSAKLKVILQTSLLSSVENIARASVLAIISGADFIKTSTGKEGSIASLEAAYVMCKVIKEFEKVGEGKVGFKAAGGINKASDAANYLALVKDILGEDFATPEYFRIGASSLVNNLLSEISGEDEKYF